MVKRFAYGSFDKVHSHPCNEWFYGLCKVIQENIKLKTKDNLYSSKHKRKISNHKMLLDQTSHAPLTISIIRYKKINSEIDLKEYILHLKMALISGIS